MDGFNNGIGQEGSARIYAKKSPQLIKTNPSITRASILERESYVRSRKFSRLETTCGSQIVTPTGIVFVDGGTGNRWKTAVSCIISYEITKGENPVICETPFVNTFDFFENLVSVTSGKKLFEEIDYEDFSKIQTRAETFNYNKDFDGDNTAIQIRATLIVCETATINDCINRITKNLGGFRPIRYIVLNSYEDIKDYTMKDFMSTDVVFLKATGGGGVERVDQLGQRDGYFQNKLVEFSEDLAPYFEQLENLSPLAEKQEELAAKFLNSEATSVACFKWKRFIIDIENIQEFGCNFFAQSARYDCSWAIVHDRDSEMLTNLKYIKHLLLPVHEDQIVRIDGPDQDAFDEEIETMNFVRADHLFEYGDEYKYREPKEVIDQLPKCFYNEDWNSLCGTFYRYNPETGTPPFTWSLNDFENIVFTF